MPEDDAAIAAIAAVIAVVIIALAMALKSRNEFVSSVLATERDRRFKALTQLATCKQSPNDIGLPRAALKYKWLAFYPRPIETEILYLKTDGHRMRRRIYLIGIAQDQVGETVFGAIESGKFRVFYVNRLADIVEMDLTGLIVE